GGTIQDLSSKSRTRINGSIFATKWIIRTDKRAFSFWGAQAASLQRSAACRTHSAPFRVRDQPTFAASCRELQASSLCSPDRIDENNAAWFTSRAAQVKFTHVDLGGTGEERVEVGEISRLHSRHYFIRFSEV